MVGIALSINKYVVIIVHCSNNNKYIVYCSKYLMVINIR